jgi:hypothetical protein
MQPTSRAVARLSMLGGLILGLALVLSACGSEGKSMAGGGATTQVDKRREVPVGGASPCQGKLDGFLDSLDTLRGQLAVGLSYEAYVDEVRRIRKRYDGLPVDRLTIDCLIAVGTPSEKALDGYIEAVNLWGECLADVSCPAGSVEPKLQHKWQVASHWLSEAHLGSRGVQAR